MKGKQVMKIKKETKMKTNKINCEKMKEPNTLSAREVGKLVAKYEYAQTPEMVKYYKSLNPSLWDVSDLITSCEYTQTPEMLEFFKSLNPSEKEIKQMLQFYKKLRRKNLKKQ